VGGSGAPVGGGLLLNVSASSLSPPSTTTGGGGEYRMSQGLSCHLGTPVGVGAITEYLNEYPLIILYPTKGQEGEKISHHASAIVHSPWYPTHEGG